MGPAPPWPNWLDQIWAKSPRGSEQTGETLAQHTWRVLERLRDLTRIRPGLPGAIGEPRLWHRLFWACVFHDVGKAAPGFQDRLRGMRNTPSAARWGRHRHEVLSLGFVAWAFPPARRGSPGEPLSVADRRWVVGAVASHHRDAAEIASLYPWEADDQLAVEFASFSEDTVAGIHQWITECALAWAAWMEIPGVGPVILPPLSDALDMVRARGAANSRGLLQEYGRWVGDLGESFSPTTPELLMRGLILQADHTASAHARGLVPLVTSPADLQRKWQLEKTFSHQDVCAMTGGSAVLIAPTGTGKTEAALLWAARQAERDGRLARLFYALPYQASMNAMLRRLQQTFGAKRVGLQHGRALLALYRLAMESDADTEAAARQARWHRKLAYLNYYPLRVFSPYQMLKAMYRLKGYEAMLLDFYGSAFIFDEIHAYDPERLGLILAMVSYLRSEFHAHFLIMSATLPSIVREHVATAIGPHSVIQASTEIYRDFRRHRIVVLTGDLLDHLDLIVEQARQGHSVLVCCNTVQRSQDAWQALLALLPEREIILLHGRFNGRDRLSREETVRDATGAKSATRRPIVLVATQVVEVSLDIDLDTIFTDPAPLEALVQRFGRINRRRLQTDLAPVHVFRNPSDGQGVYDPLLVQAGLRTLESADGEALDEAAVAGWLDNVYSGELKAAWEEKFARSLREGQGILDGLHPFQSDESLADQFDAAFDNVEVLPAGLRNEYQRLSEVDPILASALLVPITERRRRQLWRRGLIYPGTRPATVEIPYTRELGLDLSSRPGAGQDE